MTRGLMLNNPMNIEEDHINWHGQIKPTADPQHFLAQFDTMVNGVHAGARSLLNQQLLHGLDSWGLIITRYAPPSSNDTMAYIKTMANATGVGPNDKIDLRDFDFMVLSCKAIIRQEQGKNNGVPDDVIQKGVSNAMVAGSASV